MADIKARVVLDGEQNFKSGIKSINTELKTMESEVKAVEAEIKSQGASVENLTKKQEALSKAQQSAANLQQQLGVAIEAARKKYEAATKATEENRKKLDDAKKSGTATAEEIAKLEKAVAGSERAERTALNTLNSYETQLNKAKVTTENLNGQMADNERQLKALKDPYGDAAEAAGDFADNTKKSGDAINTMAQAMIASGVNAKVSELRDLLLDCVDAAVKYQAAMAKVGTLTGDADLSEFSDGIMELSNNLGVSATDIADSMYQALSASVDAADALKFVEQSTKLSIGGFTDATTAVDVLTTIINAYNLKATDAARISDILVNTQNLGKTTVQQLGQSLGQVIPLAATYNVKLENLASAYVVMTRGGINTANATTYIRAAMQELGDDSSAVSGILEELTGKNFAQLSAAGLSLGDIMQMLGQSVNNDATAFANLWSNQRAGLGAMSILNAGTEEYAKTMESMADATGVAEENFAKIAGTGERAGARLTTSLENLKIAVGSELQKPLDAIKGKITNIVTGITEWVKANPGLVRVIGALVTGLTTLAAAMTAYVAITKIASELTNIFSEAVGGSMVGKIVLAVTAVISAVAALSGMMADLKDESQVLLEETEALAKSHRESAEAYRDSMADYEFSIKAAEDATERATAAEDAYQTALARRREILVENERATYNAEEATSKAEKTEAELRAQIAAVQAAGGDTTVMYQQLNSMTANYNKTLEETNSILEENQDELARAEADANYYYLRQVDLDIGSRRVVDALLDEIDTMDKTSDQYQDTVAELKELTDAHDLMASKIQEDIDAINAEMTSLQAEYDKTYESAMASLSGQFGLLDNVDVKFAQSVGDIIGNLQSQAAYMEEYSANLAWAIEHNLSEGLVQSLSDGSQESAAILQAIVADGGAQIDNLNAAFETVSEGKEAFARQLAETQTDFNNKMSSLEGRLDQAVGKMNQENKAYQNAVSTISGFLNGSESMRGAIASKYDSLAQTANNAFRNRLQIQSPSKVFEKSGEFTVQGVVQGVENELPELAKVYSAMGALSFNQYASAVEPAAPLPGTSGGANIGVNVYLGNKELTNTMYSGIVKRIETTNRNASAMAGRA